MKRIELNIKPNDNEFKICVNKDGFLYGKLFINTDIRNKLKGINMNKKGFINVWISKKAHIYVNDHDLPIDVLNHFPNWDIKINSLGIDVVYNHAAGRAYMKSIDVNISDNTLSSYLKEEEK